MFQLTPENPVGKDIIVKAIRKHNSRVQNVPARTESNYAGDEMAVTDRFRKVRAKHPVFKETYEQQQKRHADDRTHKQALSGAGIYGGAGGITVWLQP